MNDPFMSGKLRLQLDLLKSELRPGAGPGWGSAVQAFTYLMGYLMNLFLFGLMKINLTVVITVIIL